MRSILTDVNREELIQALKEASGRVGGPDGAASRLGLKRTTFITRMQKLGIDPSNVLEARESGENSHHGADLSVTQPSS